MKDIEKFRFYNQTIYIKSVKLVNNNENNVKILILFKITYLCTVKSRD